VNSDTVYITQFRNKFLHNWHSRLSERSYFTRNWLFLTSTASLTGNTPNSVSRGISLQLDLPWTLSMTRLVSISETMKPQATWRRYACRDSRRSRVTVAAAAHDEYRPEAPEHIPAPPPHLPPFCDHDDIPALVVTIL